MLVSAIMPTRGRRQHALCALACWVSQTWPLKELVILDDLDDRSFPDGIEAERVQYHLMDKRLSVGAKRNIACSRAQGDVIVHWDDDDASATGRIEDQVNRLTESRMQVTGYHSMMFEGGGKRWRYTSPWDNPDKEYALGTSLCYRKEFWRRHPFKDVNVAEDDAFVAAARRERALVSVDAGNMMVATIHEGNTSVRDLSKRVYEEVTC
jgi:O-antigen biosynthesis protein